MTTKTRIQFPARAVTLGSLVALTAMAGPAVAGTRTESVQCGDAYDRGALWRALFGEAWRGVWPEEVNVPVLDLDTFGGGLTPFKEDGNQSKTLRFHGGDGRTYIFRSTEKNVQKSLPKDLKHTPISVLVQDQISSLHPTGHLVVAPLEKATGVLHSSPTLVVMPDDARLGKYRDEFAGMLGQIEERPDDEAKGRVFADADDI